MTKQEQKRECEAAMNASYLADKKRAEVEKMTMQESLIMRGISTMKLKTEFGQEIFDETLRDIKAGIDKSI